MTNTQYFILFINICTISMNIFFIFQLFVLDKQINKMQKGIDEAMDILNKRTTK